MLYDHLGKLVLANLLWWAALLLPVLAVWAVLGTGNVVLALGIGLPVLVLTCCVVAPVFAAGIAHMAKAFIDTGDGSLRDMFRGMVLYWRQAVAVGFIYSAALTVLLVSAWFYAVRLAAAAPLLGYAISGFAIWCLALALLTQMLVIPAVVQKKSGAIAAFKVAMLLVLDNPLFCAGLLIYFVFLALISVIIPPFAAFFSGAAAVLLSSAAYEMLARKYAAVEREKVSPGSVAPGRLSSVMCRDGKLVFDDSKDDYLNRGFREFLFPWKV